MDYKKFIEEYAQKSAKIYNYLFDCSDEGYHCCLKIGEKVFIGSHNKSKEEAEKSAMKRAFEQLDHETLWKMEGLTKIKKVSCFTNDEFDSLLAVVFGPHTTVSRAEYTFDQLNFLGVSTCDYFLTKTMIENRTNNYRPTKIEIQGNENIGSRMEQWKKYIYSEGPMINSSQNVFYAWLGVIRLKWKEDSTIMAFISDVLGIHL